MSNYYSSFDSYDICYQTLSSRLDFSKHVIKNYSLLFHQIFRHKLQMSQRSSVHPLPILFKNEQHYADCVDILEAYESEMIKIFTGAFGNDVR